MTDHQDFEKEGIFRICARNQVITDTEALLRQSSLSIENAASTLHDLDPYERADVLKSALRKRKAPLISESCLEALVNARTLTCAESSSTPHTSSEHVALFMNSSLSTLPDKDNEMVRGLLDFFRLVINHEEESNMGVTNLASIFALIFFGTPVTLDPLVFVKESKKRTAMLEFLLVLYTEHHDMFNARYACLTPMVATRTLQCQSTTVLRGERVTLFFSTEGLGYLHVAKYIVCVKQKHLSQSFSLLSEDGAIIPQRREKRFSAQKQEKTERVGSWPRAFLTVLFSSSPRE